MANEASGTRRKYVLYLNKEYSSQVLDYSEKLKSEPYEVIRAIVETYFNSEASEDIDTLQCEIYNARSRTMRNKERYQTASK